MHQVSAFLECPMFLRRQRPGHNPVQGPSSERVGGSAPSETKRKGVRQLQKTLLNRFIGFVSANGKIPVPRNAIVPEFSPDGTVASRNIFGRNPGTAKKSVPQTGSLRNFLRTELLRAGIFLAGTRVPAKKYFDVTCLIHNTAGPRTSRYTLTTKTCR
jgi:hypothetical protein